VLLTAARPDRVERLVLHGTWARHPWLGEDRREFGAVERGWGDGRTYAILAESIARTAGGRRFLGRMERLGATPGTARRLVELMSAIDVTAVLPSIHVPTLVVHRTDDPIYGIAHAYDLVAGIPGARLVELPGSDHFLFSGDTGPILDAVREFVVGAPAPPPLPDRFLATVLSADVVAGGYDDFAAAARRCVAAHHGRLVGLSGGTLLATFDGPGRGVRAACDLRDALAPLGTEIRVGVHTAEVERRGEDIAGVGVAVAARLAGAAEVERRGEDIAGVGVAVAARLAGAAEPGAVWVSRTVTDLVAGCGLAFAARGEHRLDGLARPLDLYEVVV
jgi:class 3 adenylate cyclase